MDIFLLTIFWLGCIIAIGWSTTRIIIYNDSQLASYEKTAVSYCLGLAAVSLAMAALAFFGINFSIPSILLSFLPIILITLFLGFKKFKGIPTRRISFNFKETPLLEKFFILAISFEVAYVFFRTFIKPMEAYDAIAIYAFKAKIFYLARTIPANFFKDFAGFIPHTEYPLLISLAETSFYVFLGVLNDLLVKLIFPLYYTALLVIFYSVSNRFLNRRGSLFFTFLLATIPQVTDFATNGYVDLPFSCYSSASFFYLYLWLRERKSPFLTLSFILSAAAMWTKAEGILFAAINSAVVTVCMAKEKSVSVKAILYAIASFMMITLYVLIWRMMGLGVNTDFASSASSTLSRITTGLGRIPAILYEYQIQFFGPKKWNILWIIFIAGFILKFKKIFSKELMPVTAAILLVLSGYSVVYMLSSAPQGFGWHLSTSGSRLFLHFTPIAVFWLALLFKELKLEI